MDQLEFSVIVPDVSLPELLESFGVVCQIHEMTWDQAWEELVKIGLYRHGPDVSQVGTTWLGDLVATDALRPFTNDDIDAMGGPSAFLPASWQTAGVSRRKRAWSIPWLADTRVIFYWRDMLEQAGVDEQTAFQSPESIEDTLARLQVSGMASPWAVWGERSGRAMLQTLASWVWGAGGDFVSADGKQLLLSQPETREGFLAFFSLHRYLPHGLHHIYDLDAQDLFTRRQVAVTSGSNGWLLGIYDQSEVPDAVSMVGVVAPPGPVFVGGSNLVVWQHTPRRREAVELVRFLTGHEMQMAYCRANSQLSVRPDVLSEPPFSTDAHFRIMVKALETGRIYPAFPKWDLVEQKLSEATIGLWDVILSDPGQDLETTITEYLDALARRLSVTLGLHP